MKRTNCEYIVWNGLPIIRKGIVISMINDYGLKQSEAAEKLGITSAAVSQYISGKRAKKNVLDKEIQKEMKISAGKIIAQGDKILVSEICRLCNILTSKNIISFKK